MGDETDFITWALDPARTVEEAFCAELLVESGLAIWRNRHNIPKPGPPAHDFEAERQRQRQRRFNPAHRVTLTEPDVLHAAEGLPGLTYFRYWTYGDGRPLRDLSGLRFCPGLRKLEIAPTELLHLNDLRALPDLVDLWLQDEILETIAGLAGCPRLKQLHLWFLYPWVDLRALADLPELEELTLHANLPALRGVGPLPRVTKVLFKGWGNGRAPLRDAGDLPFLPLAHDVNITPWANLDGIAEKLPAAEDLTVEGPFKNLAPLASLGALRKLLLGGHWFQDLAPLARAPRLAVLELAREVPPDLTPLLDSASLREVRPGIYRQPMSPEMAGLNAALGGWESEFLLPTPRPLPPPVFRMIQHRDHATPDFAARRGRRESEHPAPIHEAEGLWLSARLAAAMRRAFGPDWGENHCYSHSATRAEVDVHVHDYDLCERVEEVTELLRRELAQLVNHWVVNLTLDPRSGWQRDPEEWKDRIQRELEDDLAEAHDRAQRRCDYLAYLDRLTQLRLREEQGRPAPPEEFAPPADDEEDEEDGGVDVDEVQPGSFEDNFRREAHPRWYETYMVMDVCEAGVWAPVGYRHTAERLFCRPFEKFPGWNQEDEKDD